MPADAIARELDHFDALDDDAFRLEIRGWVEANYPPDMIRHPSRRLFWRENREWFMRLSRKGWIAPSWPREYGGMGLSGPRQLIMIEELERYGAARVNDQGLIMLGPLLIKHGTKTQREFFLPRILSGEHVWAQAYSEPDAGSDLAALRLDAADRGDHWILNGQKTWITLGTDANWVFVLARTNKSGKKQEGISFLLVPVDSPGLTVRGITNLDLQAEFAEMFFGNVRVPKDAVVGEVDKGWSYAKALLGFERIAIGSPKLSSNGLARLEQLADELGVADEPEVRAALSRFQLDLADVKSLYSSIVAAVKRGEMPNADISVLKMVQTELFQRITEAMVAIGG
ncbi:MAG: acyl-CoA dehydrogenase family protein, partial [Acetobacteraceae bacterium]|nr:acyl-CoA dehydrogenase family protein [Acetobacteraceae bacterium]